MLLLECRFGGLTALDACVRVCEGQRQGENKNWGKFHLLCVRAERAPMGTASTIFAEIASSLMHLKHDNSIEP